MSVHLHRDLERLHQHVMSVGGLVETATGKAVRALVERRPSLAEEVLSGDRLIDQREVEVEEECLKMLALHQPVAGDLRFLVAVLKLNNDLERMGDLAGNLADVVGVGVAISLVQVPTLVVAGVSVTWSSRLRPVRVGTPQALGSP